jgi:aspartyl-tRNA(Asn)/glutamyl-tRNA(Gln) amidotransferase subunit B
VPDNKWIEELRKSLPEKPAERRKRLQLAWSVPDKEMTAMVNAELLDTVEQTVLLGADPTKARSWWLGEISRIANDREVFPTDLITTKDVAEIIALIANGDLTDKLARQVVEGVIAGEGSATDVIAKRGLKVVSDDSQLMKAIENAIAASPETADRVRGGNVPAAGALIGAVMKATGGQADAAKVRELLLKHLGQ